MINEETIAVLGLLNSDVLTDFPSLKLIIPQGRQMDDLKTHIDRFAWLSDAQRHTIYEGNARHLFKLDGRLATPG